MGGAHGGATCMGVWIRLSPVEAGVPLRGESGRSREGLCQEVLAGELHTQGNKRKRTNCINYFVTWLHEGSPKITKVSPTSHSFSLEEW